MPRELNTKPPSSFFTQKRLVAVGVVLLVLGIVTFFFITLPGDVIHFTCGCAKGETGILVDGMKNGSLQSDERFTGVAGADIPVGNYTSSTGKIIGYSDRRSPTYVKNVSWTNGADTVTLDLEDELYIPVYVWIVKGPFDRQRGLAIEANITASQIWVSERQGIRFGSFTIVDATQNPNASNYIGAFNRFYCISMEEKIKWEIGYVPGSINVYYVDIIDDFTDEYGITCPANNDVIAMGWNTNSQVLAHELGHAFSLGHIDGLDTFFDKTNVMHPNSSQRQYLTEGQTFRSIINRSSAINGVYNARPGLFTHPNCDTSTISNSPACPPVQKRIWKDGGEDGKIWPPN